MGWIYLPSTRKLRRDAPSDIQEIVCPNLVMTATVDDATLINMLMTKAKGLGVWLRLPT